MLIKTKDRNIILPSEITDREIYEQRRDFIRQSGQFALAAATSLAAPVCSNALSLAFAASVRACTLVFACPSRKIGRAHV